MKIKRVKWLGSSVAAFCVGTWLLFNFPQLAFATSVSSGKLALYSDRPFDAEHGKLVLELAQNKLAKSPLYDSAQTHNVFIAHSKWRRVLFFHYFYNAGGINYYPMTTNVFLRPADIANNRLFATSGKPVAGNRTLDYYVAHEITHTLTGQSVGPVEHLRMPRWKRQGYADYVGKGGDFDLVEARKMLLAGDARMSYAKAGLYLHYHLLVAYLLERRGFTVEQLLNEEIDESAVENMIRADTSLDALPAKSTS